MRTILKLAGCCLFLLAMLMFATDPRTVPSVVLILPFILVFGAVFLALLFVGVRQGLSRTRAARIAVFGAALPALVLVLQSLGQLTLRDVLTILVLFCIAYLYMTRISRKMEN